MQASIEWTSTMIHKTSCKSQSLLGGNCCWEYYNLVASVHFHVEKKRKKM